MADLSLRDPATELAATDLIPALVDGSFDKVPALLLVYKDADGTYHVGDFLEITDQFGAGTAWFGYDNVIYFGNKARTLVDVTINRGTNTIFDYDIEGLGNISILGNADFGNSSGDTFGVAGTATFSHNTVFGSSSSKTATFNAKATFPNQTGIKQWDTDVSHTLGWTLNQNLTGNRTWNLIPPDANSTFDWSAVTNLVISAVAGTLLAQTSQANMRTTGLGLGDMAIQAASAVAITGGAIGGLTSLGVAGPITATKGVAVNPADFSRDANDVPYYGIGFNNAGGLSHVVLQGYFGVDVAVNAAVVGAFSAAGFAVTGVITATNSITTSGGSAGFRMTDRDAVGIMTWYNSNNTVRLHEEGGAGDFLTATTTAMTFAGSFAPAGLLDISGASAGQIKFPATQNPSSNANTLDDYEEGTFTPGISFGGGTTGLTYSSQSASYEKVGRQVTVRGSVTINAKGSSTGAALITGLPFTVGNNFTPAIILPYGAAASITDPRGWANYSATTIQLYNFAAGNITQLNDADFVNDATVYFEVTYSV